MGRMSVMAVGLHATRAGNTACCAPCRSAQWAGIGGGRHSRDGLHHRAAEGRGRHDDHGGESTSRMGGGGQSRGEIGSATCWERVCQYAYIAVGAQIKKKKK